MAVKAYSVGDVIVIEEPIVHVLDNTQKQLRCDYCLFINKSLKCCAKCGKTYYCDRECQKSDWRLHKNECDVYRNYYDTVCLSDNLLRLIARLWLSANAKSIKLTKTVQLFEETSESINGMKCYEREINADNSRMKQFESVCDAFDKCHIRYTNDTLLTIFGLVLLNMFTINNYESNYQSVAIGYGLYACRACVHHSCAPNACSVFNGFRLQLTAIKSIACDQSVTISYIPLAMSKPDRQSLLKSQFYIECNCDKCDTHSDSDVDYHTFNRYSSLLYQTILSGNYKTWPKMFEIYYLLYGKFFNLDVSNDGLNVDSLSPIILDDLLVMSSKIYGEYDPSLAVLLMLVMQQKLINFDDDNHWEDISTFIARVGRVILVSFGCEHQFYRMFEIFDLLKNM